MSAAPGRACCTELWIVIVTRSWHRSRCFICDRAPAAQLTSMHIHIRAPAARPLACRVRLSAAAANELCRTRFGKLVEELQAAAQAAARIIQACSPGCESWAAIIAWWCPSHAELLLKELAR